ncbi:MULTISPECIES: glycosyltransferase family 4 protein [Pseudomonas]|uniref:Glycosyltransferase family 1 protein n=1 Tax=Pseudomonas rhizophila TaxID=2045200 RepID=A0ABM6UF19_9PSED|nr:MULTISPECIES: glycosyltransferase family 4 protein [Pseudomonas]AVU76086.1 glycosyltransferase family 1 protein [Pseudomonas rhizophila]
MRFLLVASFPESIMVFRGELIKALLRRGFIVHIAAPNLSLGSAVRKDLEEAGLQVHEIPLRRVGMNPLSDVLTLWSLWRLMLRIKPDVFLGYTIKPVIYGLLAARLAWVPKRFALITGLGYSFQGNSTKKGSRNFLRTLVQGLYRLALRGANKVFFQNSDDQRLFLNRKLIHSLAKTVVVNGSGVDLVRYKMQPLPSRMSFLLIARLLGDKGVREYAEAARRVRGMYPYIKFYLVGWLDDNPDTIGKHELESWVSDGTLEFLGRLDDVRPAIVNSSVYVLPSYREGTPRTVLEAMAMGRPIITTDAPGCRETVSHGLNGLLVSVRSVDDLVQAMVKLIENREVVERMAIASRAMAEEKYDVHKVNDIMLLEMNV